MGVVGLYGRHPATHPVGYKLIDNFVSSIPEPPASFDHTNGFDGFKMLGNGPDPTLTVHGGNPVGDCAFVGTVNVDVIDAVETGEPVVLPTADTVVSEYLTYDGGVDQGANLTQLLAYWHRTGLWGSKILGYAAVNFRELDEVWAYANAFGVLYIGIAVPAAMEEQVANGQTLDLTGTAADTQILGGHCVDIISRSKGGGEIVTWGQRVAFTDRWLQTYMEEAHVVITQAQFARNGDGYGIALPTLQSSLAGL